MSVYFLLLGKGLCRICKHLLEEVAHILQLYRVLSFQIHDFSFQGTVFVDFSFIQKFIFKLFPGLNDLFVGSYLSGLIGFLLSLRLILSSLLLPILYRSILIYLVILKKHLYFICSLGIAQVQIQNSIPGQAGV